jgi:hypothetical protein
MSKPELGPRDRPVIPDELIQAGIDAWWEFGFRGPPDFAAGEVVAAIHLAMLKATPKELVEGGKYPSESCPA